MNQQLPKGVQFKTIKPLGIYQEFRDFVVTPNQSFQNVFKTTDIVRLQFNLKDWYIDPYESFIECDVQLSDETAFTISSNQLYHSINSPKPKFYMLDGPSTSLINDYRLIVNSKEIERIREYDQLGVILTDLNMYPESVDQKDYEGYYSIKGKQTISQNNFRNQNGIATQSTQQTTVGTTSLHHGYYYQNIPCLSASQRGAIYQSSAIQSSSFRNKDTDGASYIKNTYGICVGSSMACCQFGKTDNYYTGIQYNSFDVAIGLNTAGTREGSLGDMYGQGTFLGDMTIGNSNFGICSTNNVNFGQQYPCIYSPKMDQIDGHGAVLTNLPCAKYINGKGVTNSQNMYLTQQPQFTQTRQSFKIPLLSGVMGVLIPSDRWQLIPTSSLGNVNMEFRFNEFAFISHNGYTPDWKITKFQLKLRIYRFDKDLQLQLKQQLKEGIQMHSQIFSMGPQYDISGGNTVTNNWQLNNGINSLKQLYFWFIPKDYQQYKYARKSFRISHNLTSMQLKIGSQYIPQKPVQGHSGNFLKNSVIQSDNTDFITELHQAVNIMFDCKKHININKLNFGVNDRFYDVTGRYFDNVSFGSYADGSNIGRQFLDYGVWLHEELRCRGKALYAFNLEADKKNDDTMTGVDTTDVRPIELIIESDNTNIFSRDSQLFVMFLADFIVSFNDNDIFVEGVL